jgi:hypothetical protein
MLRAIVRFKQKGNNMDTSEWKQNEFETVDDAEREVIKLRLQIKGLKRRLAEHDGCSRFCITDDLLIRESNS